MIFVTVGTQLPFDRLIRGMDHWAEAQSTTKVIAQTGTLGPQNYVPRFMEHAPSFDPHIFKAHCRKAQLIVAHAGTGSLLTACACGTPLLMMPRKAALGEHRNDHQIAMAEGLANRSGVHVVLEEAALSDAVDALLAGPATPPELSASADTSLIDAVRALIFDSA